MYLLEEGYRGEGGICGRDVEGLLGVAQPTVR